MSSVDVIQLAVFFILKTVSEHRT